MEKVYPYVVLLIRGSQSADNINGRVSVYVTLFECSYVAPKLAGYHRMLVGSANSTFNNVGNNVDAKCKSTGSFKCTHIITPSSRIKEQDVKEPAW